MLDFFKGWRRKTGVVTLVTATLVTMAWIRSDFVFDSLKIVEPAPDSLVPFHDIVSANGNLCWGKFYVAGSGARVRSFHASSEAIPREKREEWLEDRFIDPGLKHGTWRVSYSSLATPLILLSAYLLLWPSKADKAPMAKA